MPRTRRLAGFLAATMFAASVTAAAIPGGSADAYTTVVYNGAGPSAPRIGIIGDSTIAALRWTGTFEPLKRFNFVYDAESCRRTAIASCRGREGYQPENTITTMRRLSGRWGSVLVIMGGYDDPGYGFASAVDAVMAEAARQGIPTVMWLTMRTADVSYVGPTFASNTYTFRDNNRILLQKGQQYGDRLQIADWATYSANHSEWFYSDGIHFRPAGASAAASYIASTAARVLSGITVTPPAGGPPSLWASIRRFDRGSSVAAMQRALIEAGYGFFGGATGVFGQMTEAAVRRFQEAHGLPATGIVDSRTAERLGLVNYSGTARAPEWRTLRRGMAGTLVVRAQQILTRRGFTVAGGATGMYDVHLYNAVVAFQRKHGLPVTGIIDAATARKLELYSGDWSDLRLGFSGTRVTQAQQALIAAGVPLVGGATGRFDSRMNTAVRSFQIGQGLPVTGVIDAATAARLGLLVAPARNLVWTNLTVQSRGPAVANAQRAMMEAGIYVAGGATGIFDGWTKNAVINFQRRNALPVTGIIDHGTARKLGLFDTSDPQSTWSDLRLFSVGPLVARAEQALNAAGYPVGTPNNVFDKYTYHALRRYQAARKLPVTGVINLATARSLGLFGSSTTALVTLSTTAPATSTTTTLATTTTAPTTTTASSTTVAPTTTSLPSTSTTTSTAPQSSDPTTAAPGVAAVGDLVWFDGNGDGLYGDDELGVAGVVIRLLDASGGVVAEDTSDEYGAYHFDGVPVGSYMLEIDLPEGHVPTPAAQGDDVEVDSELTVVDPEPRTARSEPISVDGDRDDLDIGLVADTDAGGEPPVVTVDPAVPTTSADAPVTSVAVTEAPEPTAVDTTSTEPATTTSAPTTTEAPPPPTEPPTTVATTTTTTAAA